MRLIERYLDAHDYEVLNVGYPSRSAPISALAARVADEIRDWHADVPLDFVTHSLGGILLRAAVDAGALPLARVQRAVMLGPPNTGSELADLLPHIPLVGRLYRVMTGPAGVQLDTSAMGVPAQLPPVPFQVGIIAGTRSWNPLFSAILGEPNDGKVRIERTRVAGMHDFIEVPYWHPLLMTPTQVHEQILHFLTTGRFRPLDTDRSDAGRDTGAPPD